MKISKSSVFYNVMTLTFSNIALHLLGFLYRIFLSRLTGEAGMGVYQLILPAYSVVSSICITGLTMATSRLCARFAAENKQGAAHRVVLLSLRIFLTLFAIIGGVITAFPTFIAGEVLGDIRTKASLLIILPCLLFTGVENILKNYFFGVGKLKPPITSELCEQIVRFIAVIALLLIAKPKNAATSSALIICGMVISEVVSVFILTRFYRPRADKSPLLSKIAKIAFPVSLAALLNTLLGAANSVLIPKRLVAFGMDSNAAIEHFGVLFGMTLPLVNLPFGLLGALITVIIPKMSGAIHPPFLRRKAGKTIHTTSLIAFPAVFFLIPFGRDLCTFVYNNQSAGRYMLPLCIAAFFSFYHMSLTGILNAIGYEKRAAAISFIGGGVQLLGTYLVGLRGIGMAGFLAGDIASAIICAALSLAPIVKKLKLRIPFANWFLRPALSATLSAFTANFIYKIAINDGISAKFALILVGFVFTFTYLATLRLLGTSLITYLKRLQW